jgi:hypothetical protein
MLFIVLFYFMYFFKIAREEKHSFYWLCQKDIIL